MNGQQPRSHAWRPAALAVAIALSMLGLLHFYERSARRMEFAMLDAEVRRFLPVLRGLVTPDGLAEEIFLRTIEGMEGPLAAEAAGRMAARFTEAVGSEGAFLALDREGNELIGRRFASDTRDLFRHHLAAWRHREDVRSHLTDEEYDRRGLHPPECPERLKRHPASRVLDPRNEWTEIEEAEEGGERGFLLTHVVMRPAVPDLSARKLQGLWVKPDDGKPLCGGLVAAFIPHRLLDTGFRRRFLTGMRHPSFGMFWCGEVAALGQAPLPPGLGAAIARQAGEWAQGTVPGPDGVFGFWRNPRIAEEVVVVGRSRSSSGEGWRRAASLLLLLVVAGLAWGAGRRLQDVESPWRQPLGGKMAIVLGGASLFPVVFFQLVLLRSQPWTDHEVPPDLGQVLEERLADTDEWYRRELQTALQPFTTAVLERLWEEIRTGRTKLADWIDRVGRRTVQVVVIEDRAGRVARERGDVDRTWEQRGRLFDTLAQTYRGVLGFAEGSEKKGGGATDQLSGTMLLESAGDLLGFETVNNWFSRSGELVNFVYGDQPIWHLNHVFVEANGRPAAFLHAVPDRTAIQRQPLLAKMLSDDPRRAPLPLVGFAQSLVGHIRFLPERLGRIPLIRQTIRRLLAEEGSQVLTFTWKGVRYIAQARRLGNSDFLAVAIVPHPVGREGSRQAGGWGGVVGYPLLVLLTVGWLFRRFYLQPVADLAAGAATIAGGQYEVRLAPASDDEIGQLATSFTRMAEGLQEKEFLARFLSDLTLEAVRQGETPAAIRSRASILFSDIRGFTGLAEKVAPERLAAGLNGHFTAMEELIEREGGTIDKFIGDALMAVFLPVHGREDPAVRAVRAGLAMLEASRLRFDPELPLAIGVGVGTGDVLMGTVGRPDGRRDFTVVGPTVRLAALMEKRSKQAAVSPVIVCPTTLTRLGGAWPAHRLPDVPGEPKAFEIRRPRGVRTVLLPGR